MKGMVLQHTPRFSDTPSALMHHASSASQPSMFMSPEEMGGHAALALEPSPSTADGGAAGRAARLYDSPRPRAYGPNCGCADDCGCGCQTGRPCNCTMMGGCERTRGGSSDASGIASEAAAWDVRKPMAFGVAVRSSPVCIPEQQRAPSGGLRPPAVYAASGPQEARPRSYADIQTDMFHRTEADLVSSKPKVYAAQNDGGNDWNRFSSCAACTRPYSGAACPHCG